jgi:hypothetical protein
MPVLKDCNIWYSEYDLTSVANELSVETMYADVDVTTFGSAGAHTRVGGLQDSNISLMTFLDTSISEPAFFANRGGVVELVTAVAFPTGGTVTAGDRCYASRAMLKTISDPMKVGDAAKINATLSGAQAEGVLQGLVLAPKQTISVTTTTSPVFFTGGVTTGQVTYFGVHVFSLSGDRTVAFKLQSASGTGFATPVDRVTLSTISAAGSGFGSSSATTGHQYWRVVATLGGTTGSVSFAAFSAIQ